MRPSRRHDAGGRTNRTPDEYSRRVSCGVGVGSVLTSRRSRTYVEGLGHVHAVLRQVAAKHLVIWDAVVASIQQRGAERWGGGATRAFLIVQLDQSGTVVSSAQVFTELTEYRRVLERRNGVLEGLSDRYVSSADVDGDA